ncbi:MAG: thioesterase domain-containing protein [Melioribacteraceae bacterium]
MNKWILRPKIRGNAKLRLFCFPYAGSSALVTYKFLVDSLPQEIEVCLVEFPGRGTRIAENLISDTNIVVNQIFEALKEFMDLPYIFFGHSMGALISYELAFTIESNLYPTPKKLYLSAHNAPNIKRNGKLMHQLNKDEFLSELIRMDGINKEILEHEELMELVLPIIRSDYQLCETYKFSERANLNIPFHVFGAQDDYDVQPDNLILWNDLTKADFKMDIFEGDHFYIIKQKDIFLQKFRQLLEMDLAKL